MLIDDPTVQTVSKQIQKRLIYNILREFYAFKKRIVSS
jgi:hypothetical protein